jgi:hypothetical protein
MKSIFPENYQGLKPESWAEQSRSILSFIETQIRCSHLESPTEAVEGLLPLCFQQSVIVKGRPFFQMPEISATDLGHISME